MALKKATKEQAKLRLAIYGLSGGGKTYSALAIAKGMGGKVAVLDTEFRSASKYSSMFDFDTDDFGVPSVDNYIKFINEVKEAGDYNVLIIDSITHAWQYILQMVDQLKETSCHGDGRKAWGIMTPKYKDLINAIVTAPFHVIVTMRAKTEWSTSNDNGTKGVRRDTLAPEQREGFEYEFDMLMEMNATHYGNIIKDRTGKFQDQIIKEPGEAFGRELIRWLSEGTVPLDKQIYNVQVEIGSILKSVNDAEQRYFTEAEYSIVKGKTVEAKKLPPEEQLKFLNGLLDQQKDILRQRVSEALSADSETSAVPTSATLGKPSAPPASPPPGPASTAGRKPKAATTPSPEAPKSLTAEFQKRINEKQNADEATSSTVPAVSEEEHPPIEPGYITPPNAASEARRATAAEGSGVPSLFQEPEGEAETGSEETGEEEDIF